MTDDSVARIPPHDRLSLRAVLVPEGEDPTPALLAAGIYDPVALPVAFGEHADRVFATPGINAVFEYAAPADTAGADGGPATRPAPWPERSSSRPSAPDRGPPMPPIGGAIAFNPVTGNHTSLDDRRNRME